MGIYLLFKDRKGMGKKSLMAELKGSAFCKPALY